VTQPRVRAAPSSRAFLPLLSVMLFVTGACGLVYQQLWMRELSLVFGVTIYAAATVLASFMAGLALGSWLAGRAVDRARRPLAWYGTIEILVGVAALLTPAAMEAVEWVYVELAGGTDTSIGLLTALRFALGFAVLLVPSTMMGASMPIVVKSSVLEAVDLGARAGWLYAVNTAGAIVGTLLAGFVLIGEFGLWATFLIAAAANGVVGLTAIVTSLRLGPARRTAAVAREEQRAPVDEIVSPAPTLTVRRVVLCVFAVSGFVSLALEIVWFRVLVLYLESNTYAFSAMLATVLAGIAIGSALVTPFLRRRADWISRLIGLEVALAVVALTSLWFLGQSYDVADFVGNAYVPGTIPGNRFTVIASLLAIFPSALLMGIAFPIGLMIWGSTGETTTTEAGRHVGTFYAWNLTGAIAGSIVAGFVLVPEFGTRASVVFLASCLLVAALALAAVAPSRERVALGATGAVAFVIGLVLMVPDPYAAALEHRHPGERLVWSEEGIQTTVAVQQGTDGSRRMLLDGLPQANTAPDVVALHRLIGALPVALHPQPDDALVIGLGGGVTAGAAATTGADSVLVVELSDEVVDGARYFRRVNDGVTNRRDVRFRIDDGRNFLLLTDRKYDVITADIIQPQHAGAGKVWSVEYWELARDALADEGLMLQWVGRDRDEHVYKMIVRSFLEVFPDATLWADGQLLVAGRGPLQVNEDTLARKFSDPRIADALRRSGINGPDDILALYTAGPRELRRFVDGGPRLTDDRPRIEYYRSLPERGAPVDLTSVRGDVTEVLEG
jgi:spermidine synthase